VKEIFSLFQPLSNNSNGTDDSTDTYDSIEWLLKVYPNNGNVGMLGISYQGWLTMMGAVNPHPAIKAISPQGAPECAFIGDTFGQNGAFRLSPSFGFVNFYEGQKIGINNPFNGIKDAYDFYLGLGPLKYINQEILKNKSITWNNLMNHTTLDKFWEERRMKTYLKKNSIPSLSVVGWYDNDALYGSISIYNILEKFNSSFNYMVMGPWGNGGWSYPLFTQKNTSFGNIDFENDTSLFFKQIQLNFLNKYLQRKNITLKKISSFRTGSNTWGNYSSWPPANIILTPIYLLTTGIISFSKPISDNKICYISNPQNPVPYMTRPINDYWNSSSYSNAAWKVQDQSVLINNKTRDSVLVWNTEYLTKDINIAGNLTGIIVGDTNCTDTDWIIKLIDEDDSGYQLLISDRVLRGKFKDSLSLPKSLTINTRTVFTIDMLARDHCFLSGHKIVVNIQSTYFPLIDLNPNKFMDIPSANDSDFKIARNCVYQTSNIVLPVIL